MALASQLLPRIPRVPTNAANHLINLASSLPPVGASIDPQAELMNRVQGNIAALHSRYNASQSANRVDVNKLLSTLPDISKYGLPVRHPSFSGSAPQGVRISGNVDQWIATAYKLMGIPLTPSALASERYMIQHESGGNARAINLWDSNAKAGHPSKGIEQTIDSTFRAYAKPGHTDIWNPVDNIMASLGYRMGRYHTTNIGNYRGGY